MVGSGGVGWEVEAARTLLGSVENASGFVSDDAFRAGAGGPGELIRIKDALPSLACGGPMIRGDGHTRLWRWDRLFRFVAVAMFIAWGLAGAAHSPAFAAPSHGVSVVAAEHLHGGSMDHPSSQGQTCSSHGQCSGIAVLAVGPVASLEALAPQIPRAAAALVSAPFALIFRPPIPLVSA